VSEPETAAEPSRAASDAPEATSPQAPPAGEPPTSDDPLFDALWAKVLGAWDDDKAHSTVLDYAVQKEKLPDLAGRYRALKGDPTKADRAQKRLDAIILAATQLMMSMKTTPTTTVPLPITLTMFGIFLFAVGFVAYAMWHR